MPAFTKKERVRAVLARQPVDHPPVSLWGHDFLREWSPRGLVSATVEAYRAHDWDFIKFNPRATYFAEAWGAEFDRPDTQLMPRMTRVAVDSLAALADTRRVEAHGGPLGEHLYALRLLRDEVGHEVDVVQTVFSPLSVLAMMCGWSGREFRGYVAQDPAVVHGALAEVCSTLAEYARACLEAGASGVFFAPLFWSSHDTCSEDFYREFGRPYDLQVLAGIQHAEFNILHVCRDNNMIDLLLDYPVAALNWADRGVGNQSLAEIRSKTGKAVMGGIDHARLHEMAVEEIAAEARDAVASVPSGLLVTGGCGISPGATRAQQGAVVDAARGQ